MKTLKKIYVIKIGGEIQYNTAIFDILCKEIAKLIKLNIHIVIVHGGGKQVNELELKLGKSPNIIEGRRITDEGSLESIKMVIAGKVNIEILSALQCHGISAVGLSGVDGHILEVNRRPPQMHVDKQTQKERMIDYGYVAEIVSVNPDLICTLLENHFLPVIAPLGADNAGTIYNINADTVASSIACALNAELIMLTNTDGVYDQNGEILAYLSCDKARHLINEGIITHGMIPKIESIISSIQSGITAVHMMNGLKPEKLAKLFTDKSLGTLITKES